MNEKLPLAAVLISFNEERNIERTLNAVIPLVSEIIVVDSHSADRTREIAASMGAKVFDEDWKGHIAQKNSALEKCTQPWALCLDCDEVADEDLVNSVRSAVTSGDCDGYELNRRTFYMGRFLKHSWQPDWKLRLVRMSSQPVWKGYDPHDALTVKGKVRRLDGFLLHYSYKDTFDHYQRLVKYSKIAADSYHKNGKKFSYISLFFKPAFAFFKKYIMKGGFLDGFPGLAVAVSSFIYVYLKYLFLREIEKGNK